MRNLTKVSIVLAALALLIGCGSTPQSNHYILTAQAPDTVPSGNTPALGIGPVSIPEFLNRNSLVYNRGENQLFIASTERWAEPLESGITRVLSLNLAQLLNTENVRPFPWHPKRPPDYGIKIRLLNLDATQTQATMVVEWLVFHADSAEPVYRRISHLFETLPSAELQPRQIAPAYSALLLQLSELIAEAIRTAKGQTSS